MLIYGDSLRRNTPGAVLARIDDYGRAAAASRGRVRHDALVAALVEAGMLWQGAADAGADERPFADLARHAARAVLASFDSGFTLGEPVPQAATAAAAAALGAGALTLKVPEGFAFYAVRPEAYALAARAVVEPGERVCVVAIRSIGTTLAAMAAAAVGAADCVSVRPEGPPFDRRVPPCPTRARILAQAPDTRLLVADEGPGLSGSSFAAVAAMAEAMGFSPARIVFLPSHAGEPGAAAGPAIRARWAATPRRPAVLPPLAPGPLHLEAAVESLIGPLDEPLKDLSGGAWRAERRGEDLPAFPHQERLKSLARAGGSAFLVKFAGLGGIGEAKLDRARIFAASGLGAEPVGLVHGFLVEPWHETARGIDLAADRPALLDALSAWMSLRAGLDAPEEAGADLAGLAQMVRRNLALALGEDAAERVCPPADAPMRLTPRVRRVWTDGRWGAWEWLRLPDGRVVKTDTLDHAESHDLVGAQDIAWDLAGARVELALSAAETDRLAAAAGAGRGEPVDADLLRFYDLAYRAFAIGSARLAADALPDGADRARLERRLRTLADGLLAGGTG